MRRTRIVTSAAAGLLLVGAGTAVGAVTATPVDGAGVINGCWTNTAVNGSHAFVMQDSGTACPRGTTPIRWNQAGPQGPTGLAGTSGQDGADGKDGATILSGTGGPSVNLGANGDYYMDTDAHQLYGPKTNDTWPGGVSLVGPVGPRGPAGSAGSSGSSIVLVTHSWSNKEDAGGTSTERNGFFGTNHATLTCPQDHPIALSVRILSQEYPAVDGHAFETATFSRSTADVSEHGYTPAAEFTITVTLSCLGA
jgi:hypothetical protein